MENRDYNQKPKIKKKKRKKIRIVRIKELIDQVQHGGNLEYIYRKYGKRIYNQVAYEMKKREIEEVYGKRSLKATYCRAKNAVKYKAFFKWFPIVSIYLCVSAVGNTMVGLGDDILKQSKEFKEENEEKYQDEIQEYEEQIEYYAENIKKLGLTDVETILKVQEDMWNTILGYKTPEFELNGYKGISLNREEVGVCRNMADDTARRLNAIDSKYNARLCTVQIQTGEPLFGETVDVKTRNIEIENMQDENIRNEEQQYVYHEPNIINRMVYYEIIEKYELFGNHVVVLVDMPEDNITLMLDPTNMLMGILKNGKIELWNVIEEDKDGMSRKLLGDTFFRTEDYGKIPEEYLKSFFSKPNLSKEELEKKYSIENLNNALENARKKERNYLYQNAQKENFKESLKTNIVPKEKAEFEIYTYEEMKEVQEELLVEIENIQAKEDAIRIANQYRRLKYSKAYYTQAEEAFYGKRVIHDFFELDPNLEESIINTLDATDALLTNAKEMESLSEEGQKKLKYRLCEFYLKSCQELPIESLKVGQFEGENIVFLYTDSQIRQVMLWNDESVLIKDAEEIDIRRSIKEQAYKAISVVQFDQTIPVIEKLEEKQKEEVVLENE